MASLETRKGTGVIGIAIKIRARADLPVLARGIDVAPSKASKVGSRYEIGTKTLSHEIGTERNARMCVPIRIETRRRTNPYTAILRARTVRFSVESLLYSAYVFSFTLCAGSKRSIAAIRPRVPAEVISSKLTLSGRRSWIRRAISRTWGRCSRIRRSRSSLAWASRCFIVLAILPTPVGAFTPGEMQMHGRPAARCFIDLEFYCLASLTS